MLIEMMESSSDYNNHNYTLDEEEFHLIGINNKPLETSIREYIENLQPDSIESLGIYGYTGEIDDELGKDIIKVFTYIEDKGKADKLYSMNIYTAINYVNGY